MEVESIESKVESCLVVVVVVFVFWNLEFGICH